jgi:predicted small lipoprotein YifL
MRQLNKLARLFAVTIVAGLLVAGCGNKGKLYLPDKTESPQQS